ncbi:hypothetical protein DFH07DRAFT_968770 [Mycena maculata]|uniref:Uncharacterized protein n=1 Tax=Mycena maculata TaxID=230809 RepID=A0AAD7HYV3_9AGAR|nr:hypothetical protein DFH07DRAFT_968770 [Mycena maculata]
MLYDTSDPEEIGGYDEEISAGSRLFHLSGTCRYMRAETMPWIFREVYNWSRADGDVWPETLWPFIRTLHLRDHAVRHPMHLTIANDVFEALPLMPVLTRVTLRLDAPIPSDLLISLSLVPKLISLEIYQARLDGPTPPPTLAFSALENLQISICGFKGVVRANGIDHKRETENVLALLQNVNDNLTGLQISGDLLSIGFLAQNWSHLRKFSVTDHTPSPYIPVPQLVSRMPVLQDLSVLFSADITREADDIYPPFTLGIRGGEELARHSPLLTSVTLSNLEPADPIFEQLPASLEALHLLAMRDLYVPRPYVSRPLRVAPFTSTSLRTVMDCISRFDDLTQLSLTLQDFPTAEVIQAVASVFPRLRFLQLARPIYSFGGIYCSDVRDDNLLEALRGLPLLTHLRIALDFEDREFQQDPQQYAARWLMHALPGLQTVEFCWDQWRDWRWAGLEPFVWQPWDRSVLLLPPTPPPRTPSPRATTPESVVGIDDLQN